MNALILLGLLNFLYYKALPSTDPLLYPRVRQPQDSQ